MRVQLGSPKSSGLTSFSGDGDVDTLMEDRIVLAPVENGEDEEEDDIDEESIPPLLPLSDYDIQNSEELIRRLKSKDNRIVDSIRKIDIAKSAFHDTVVPVPKKSFLLADWILERISKSAKYLASNTSPDKSKADVALATQLVEEDYWALLAECSKLLAGEDVALLANRYSLPSLLHAYVFSWGDVKNWALYHNKGKEQDRGETILKFFQWLDIARTSHQTFQFDALNQCLASWISAFRLTTNSRHSLYMIELDIVRQQLEFVELIINTWSSEWKKGNNRKRAQEFFLTDLLPLCSRYLLCIYYGKDDIEDVENKSAYNKFRSLLYRISYQCLLVSEQQVEVQTAVLHAVKTAKSNENRFFLSVFLSQLCLMKSDKQSTRTNKNKDTTSWVKEKEWNKAILQSFIVPAVDIITSAISSLPLDEDEEVTTEQKGESANGMNSLVSLLESIQEWNLHFSDEEDSWRNLLIKVVDFTLLQYKEPIRRTHKVSPNLEVLIKVHQLDESIIDRERLTQSILCALHYDIRKDGLLDILCNTSIKSRHVVPFIKSCLEALESACDEEDISLASDVHKTGQQLVGSFLRDTIWQRSIGVAVRDFLSPEQAVELLNMFQERLCKAYANSAASCAQKETSLELLNFATVSTLQTTFAAVVLSHLIIPGPAWQSAVREVQLLHFEVIMKYLDWAVKHRNYKYADVFIDCLLSLHEAIQELCSKCATGNEEHGSAWLKLASDFDSDLEGRLPMFSDIMSQESSFSWELREKCQLVILNLVQRAFDRAKTSPFDLFLSERQSFGTLTRDPFHKLQGKEQVLSEIYQLPGLICLSYFDNELTPLSDLWDLLASPHMPTFDRLASPEILRSMAKLALYLTRENVNWATPHSRNLELKRWRDALCSEMKEVLAGPVSDKRELQNGILTAEVVSEFPVDWFPRQDLREIWSKMFSVLLFKPEDIRYMLHPRKVHSFLAGCLELRSDEIDASQFIRNGALYHSDIEGVPLRLVNACLGHLLNRDQQDSLERKIEKLCELLIAMEWSTLVSSTDSMDDETSAVVQRKMDEVQKVLIFMLVASSLFERIHDLLVRLGPGHDELKAKVGALTQQKMSGTHLFRGHIESYSNHYRDREALDYLSVSIHLQTAALKLLYHESKDSDKSRMEQDYIALMDNLFRYFRIYLQTHGLDYVDMPVVKTSLCLVQATQANLSVGILEGVEALKKQLDLGASFLSSDQRDEVFSSWLHLTAIMFCVSCVQFDHGCDFLDEMSATLATICRRATSQEYEAVVEFILTVLGESSGLNADSTSHYLFHRPGREFARHIPAVLQTISVLLCNSPEGTLLVSQRFLSRAIWFVVLRVKDEESCNVKEEERRSGDFQLETKVAAIQMMMIVLSARPILFRSGDISWCLTLSANVLANNNRREGIRVPLDVRTHLLSSVLTTLMEATRLRRDFVAQFLPQLTLLLIQILEFINTPISHTVKKDAQEGNWESLMLDEARQFNRLLSAITTKSCSTSMSGLPESKIKSLAKPFSTHAPYVIVAFVRTIATTSSTTNNSSSKRSRATSNSREVREELTRGIYHLCDILGPWQKNVMMDMLADEGERIVMRSLWRGWEAQRYRGA